VRKILAILFVTATVLIVLAALADPTIRYPYFGVQLERDLSSLEGTDPVTVMLSVETGTELLSEDKLSDEPAVQDEYSLLMILREDLKAQSESADVTYEVEEMESQQWAWQEAELNKLKARSQVFPRQAAIAPTLTFPKETVMASNEVWTPLITSIWPTLPKGFQKAGTSTWQDQLSFQEENPLTRTPTKVNHNLVYKLDKFVNTDRGVLVNVLVLGSVTEGSDVDPTVEVRGTLKGFVLIDPETGRTYGGEYRLEERFHVRQPGLPVLRKTTYQGARFWRPMFYKMSQQKAGASNESDSEFPAPPEEGQSP
jgi:hypothetical protein